MELNSKLLFGERLVRVFTSIFFVYSCIQHISMKLQHGVNQNTFFEYIYIYIIEIKQLIENTFGYMMW